MRPRCLISVFFFLVFLHLYLSNFDYLAIDDRKAEYLNISLYENMSTIRFVILFKTTLDHGELICSCDRYIYSTCLFADNCVHDNC